MWSQKSKANVSRVKELMYSIINVGSFVGMRKVDVNKRLIDLDTPELDV